MTATELLREIEATGGSLTLLPDGRLKWRLVPPELLAQLQPLKSEIVALLEEREKPRPWNRLIPLADLIAAHERYEAQQAAARAKQLADDIALYERQKAERMSTPEKKPFIYRARTAEQWDARANQGRWRPVRRSRKSQLPVTTDNAIQPIGEKTK